MSQDDEKKIGRNKDDSKELPNRTEDGDEASDLDSFEHYWREKGGINFRSEYHKEGAPYIEMPSEWDGHLPRLGKDPDDAMEKGMIAEDETSSPEIGDSQVPRDKSGDEEAQTKTRTDAQAQLKIGDLVDLNTFELISYGVFRSLFGRSLRLPLKREGIIDAEIQIRDKDIILNTDELYFYFPELVVWRFAYNHRGKTVMEFGRGVPNGLKIHRWRALLLLFEIWRGSRRNRRTKSLDSSGLEKREEVGRK
ncbi:MAG: hypothetical protein FJ151_02155 [Euryarchaeota archaeon]|nr:hypothetical protein [Euryarchaeota archaeon]